jgi:hypothetical protein
MNDRDQRQFLEWVHALIRRGPSPELTELARIVAIAKELRKRATTLRLEENTTLQ